MTSPLSSLKNSQKQRSSFKLPFIPSSMSSPRTQFDTFSSSPPNVNKYLENFQYANLDLSDSDVLVSKDITNCSEKISNTISSTPRRQSIVDNDSIVTLLTSRLRQTQSQMCQYSREIIEKDKRIKVLEDKVALLARIHSEEDSGHARVLSEMTSKCERLEIQLAEMEAFLADYGLMWVGNEENDEPTFEGDRPSSMWRPNDSYTHIINFDLLIQNMRELNELVSSTVKINRVGNEARLHHTKPISVVYHKDGFKFIDSNENIDSFYEYTSTFARSFVRDILDGYFPANLQQTYPDGVAFKVEDRRNDMYSEDSPVVFPGRGQAVMSAKQFADRLPRSVIKSGKIISVRQDIEDILTGNSESSKKPAGVEVIETECIAQIRNSARAKQVRSSSPTQVKTSTLRVRSENGERVFLLKMSSNETIKDLRRYIDKHRSEVGDYDISTGYPGSRILRDSSATLEQEGLVPNAVLMLKSMR